jgi:two-component system, chemotaxis family, protein-glutamate methylesterase/glutaminase
MAENDVRRFAMVVIGGSAGSLDVVLSIVGQLPPATRATIVVVVHRKNAPESPLASLLEARTKLPVKEVEDKEPIEPGTVYLAPADYHLLVEDAGSFSLDCSEKIHYSRPSIDITFESAAEQFGPALLGVLLSGANADGAEGLYRIRQAGGFTVAQDPQTAEIDYMPRAAIDRGGACAVVPANDLGSYLKALLEQ